MSGAIENLNPEENLKPENRNWSKIGKNADRHVFDVQKHLWETFSQEKYLEHTINYWLNEVFLLSEEEKSSLETKVDFNKMVSIRDLSDEIKLIDGGLSLWEVTLTIVAGKSLTPKYAEAFEDYLKNVNKIDVAGPISLGDFLELLSLLEEERPQTIHDWTEEGLMSDEYVDFEEYCNRQEKKFSDNIFYSRFVMLREGFYREQEEQKKYYSL